MAEERFINVRKLAAFDLHFRSPRIILVEFAFVVFAIGGLGLASLALGLARSLLADAIGLYLLFLGVDYIPLLVYGVSILRKGSTKTVIQAELLDEARSRRKYGMQQTLLMVPLFIPVLALSQEVRKRPAGTNASRPVSSST